MVCRCLVVRVVDVLMLGQSFLLIVPLLLLLLLCFDHSSLDFGHVLEALSRLCCEQALVPGICDLLLLVLNLLLPFLRVCESAQHLIFLASLHFTIKRDEYPFQGPDN